MGIEDGVEELTPYQFVEPCREPLLGSLLGRGQCEPRVDAPAYRDRAEAQVRREPGGARDGGQVPVDVIAICRAAEKRFQPLVRRFCAAARDHGRIRPGAAPRRHPRRIGRSPLGTCCKPRRRYDGVAPEGHRRHVGRNTDDTYRKLRRRGDHGRLHPIPAPPRALVGGMGGVRPALDGTELAAFEDDAVLVRTHFDPVAFQGIANGPVPALRVRTVVAVPRHERCLACAGEGRQAVLRSATHDDEPGPRGFERGGEVAEAGVQEPETRMGLSMRFEQRVVQYEYGHQRTGPPAGSGERGVVPDAEIVSEPVDGSHCRSSGHAVTGPHHHCRRAGPCRPRLDRRSCRRIVAATAAASAFDDAEIIPAPVGTVARRL